jgi:galactokinase
MHNVLRVSAPGRMCLFGEHQDYFGLPIIAGAINLRITFEGTARSDRRIEVVLPDIGEKEAFALDGDIPYLKERHYIRSTVNVLKRQNIPMPHGWDLKVHGEIPINSGTASSSAMVVAWITFFLEAGGDSRSLSPETIAEWAFLSEVAEFGEPGGKMDHYASAVGGVVNIHFEPEMKVVRFSHHLDEFVLADSMQRKNTTGTLGFIKGNVFSGLKKVRESIPEFTVHSTLGDRELDALNTLPADERRLLGGTLRTRDLTREGMNLFAVEPFHHEIFGQLLWKQQEVLRENIGISTPRLNELLDAAMEAGALGAKINGSGEGGCVFAYTPGRSEEVYEALARLGAKPHIVRIDEGVRRDD